MLQLELKNHPVWHDLTEILENLDSDRLVREHLEGCDYRVGGYWDERDRFYEEVRLPRGVVAELIGSSIGVTQRERVLQLRFVLRVAAEAGQRVGELLLIFNEDLEFVDENWSLEVESPLLFVVEG